MELNVPAAPPAPAPYVLTGFEDNNDGLDYLTSEHLQRVNLVKTVVPSTEEKKKVGALSDLELAVKKRASKNVPSDLVEKAKTLTDKIDNIRFEKSLLVQAQVWAIFPHFFLLTALSDPDCSGGEKD